MRLFIIYLIGLLFSVAKAEDLREALPRTRNWFSSNNDIPAPTKPSIQSNTVFFSLLLTRIDDIDIQRGTVTIDIVVFQEWNDPQRKFNGTAKIYMAEKDLNPSTWNPHIQLSPVVKSTPSSLYTRVSPDGNIETKQTTSLTIRCDHEGNFPSDELACELRISSPHKGDVHFRWNKGHSTKLENKDVKVAAPFQLSRLDIKGSGEFTSGDDNDEVMHPFNFVVRRRAAAYYWFLSIHPSIFLLLLTWSTLFLDREMFLLLRISLALVSLIGVQALNLITNSTGRASERGNVLDWWFQISSLLIFIVLIEDVIIAILINRNKLAEGDFPSERDFEKLPVAMDYLTKVFFPIVATLVLFIVFIMI